MMHHRGGLRARRVADAAAVSAVPCRWGFLVTMLIPAVGSIVWYGLLPVTNPLDPDRGDKALFVFLVHPASMTFLSYLLCSLFHISIDSDRPNRPIIHYFHILATNYVVQARLCLPCAPSTAAAHVASC